MKEHYNCEKLISNYHGATKQLKKLEHEDLKLSVPALVQLRDVASHLIRALESSNQEVIINEMRDAEKHATRARYDTAEIRISYYLSNIGIFIKNLNDKSEVLEVIPDYNKLMTKTSLIQKEFKLNLDISIESRSEYYSTIENDLDELEKISTTLLVAVPMITKKVEENILLREERKSIERAQIRREIRNYSLGVAVFLLTAVGIIVGMN